MVTEYLKWVVREKDCFSFETGKVKILRFLHMKYIKKYNNKIGGAGIADSIRKYYRIYILVSNRKWWW